MIMEFGSRILTLIDDMVEHASDDELFTSGYLCGYLMLAVTELDAGEDHSAEVLYANMTSSLEKAASTDEPSPRDRVLVEEVWDALSQKIAQ